MSGLLSPIRTSFQSVIDQRNSVPASPRSRLGKGGENLPLVPLPSGVGLENTHPPKSFPS